MLCINSYSKKYFEDCRSKVAEQVAAYRTMVKAARKQAAANKSLDAAIETFKHHFFNNMLLVMDGYFVHRARALEKKDGNPLNEVRMLCNSIMNVDNIMSADKSIKYDPAKSVLKYRIGDEIKLNETDFTKLSSAFFTEIKRKYL